VRVKVGSVAFLTAAASGYGIGLTDDGHLLEWIGPWDALAALRDALAGPEPVYLEVEDWQVLAVDEEVRLPLSRKAMAERARFVKAALGRGDR
jgi:hypothetical protein